MSPQMLRRHFRLGLLALLLLLSACSGGPDGDLVAYVERVKATQAKAPEAPQVTEKHETFRYKADSEGIRDPFSGKISRVASGKQQGQGPRPNSHRGRQALEQYPLESLSLVGTMSSANRTVALVRSDDGVIHQVKLGDYMGQNYGKVIAIEAKQIKIRELVPDGSDGWQERTTTVGLAK